MRALWVVGMVLGMLGLAGCTDSAEGAKSAPQTAKPSPLLLSVQGGIAVMLPNNGAGTELGGPCTPPPSAKIQLGQEVRVTDGNGTSLGTGKIEGGRTRGMSQLKQCRVEFAVRVSGVPDEYQLIIGNFEPMPYSREDIRRGLSFYETEQGALAQD